MDVQGSRNLVHEQLLESGKETTKQLKAVAQTFCVFIAWMIFFSHMDEIGWTLWAMFASAVLVVTTVMSLTIYILRILVSLHIIAAIGWMTSIIILSIMRLPEFTLWVVLQLLNNAASNWQVLKYPRNLKHIQPEGTRVGHNGERIIFGGRSFKQHSELGCYLGILILNVA